MHPMPLGPAGNTAGVHSNTFSSRRGPGAGSSTRPTAEEIQPTSQPVGARSRGAVLPGDLQLATSLQLASPWARTGLQRWPEQPPPTSAAVLGMACSSPSSPKAHHLL